MLVFLKKLRGLTEEWLDYYLFSIKFEWVLCNWQPSWHSFKAPGDFVKLCERQLK
jgi:hypothetical protein